MVLITVILHLAVDEQAVAFGVYQENLNTSSSFLQSSECTAIEGILDAFKAGDQGRFDSFLSNAVVSGIFPLNVRLL